MQFAAYDKYFDPTLDRRYQQVYRPSDRTTETYTGRVGPMLVNYNWDSVKNGIDRQTDRRQTISLRLPLWTP